MRKIIALLAALWFAIQSLLAAEPIVTQIRVLDQSFTKLSVATGIDVELVNGAQYLEVTAPQNIQDQLETFVEDGTLKIRYRPRRGNIRINGEHVRVKVAAPRLSAIGVSSGASVRTAGVFRFGGDARMSLSSGADIEGRYEMNDLTLSASSGADVDARIRAGNVKISASSGASVELSGTCADAAVSASSAADVECMGLVADEVVGSCSSGASIEFTSRGGARISASSGADYWVKAPDGRTIIRK